MKLPDFFQKLNPAYICICYVTIATWLTIAALFMQFILDIRPCSLCLWQRIPYFIVMFGAVLVPLRFVRFTLYMQACAFLGNVALSAYHSGVERKWWAGPSGCTVGNFQDLSIDDLYHQIMQTKIIRCDDISWSLFNLSLTNYNFIISVILALSAIYFIWGYDVQSRRKPI